MLGGARFLYKQVDFFPKGFILRPSFRHCSVSSQTEGSVIIPPRIERGPTDILKALSSTVGIDYTAFHYKYPDDPYFYSNSDERKCIFALSLESGRKAAKWIFKNNPGFFTKNLSEPPIKEFLVKSVVHAEPKPSEETLLSAIEERNVLKAIEVFEALEKEGREISESMKQSLLELVCFYDGSENADKGLDEKWHCIEIAQEKEKETIIWKYKGFAEKLFEKMDSSCSMANSAIIQGMLKHDEIELAREIFERAKVKKIKLSVDVYNMFLSRIFKGEGEKGILNLTQKWLKEMSKNNIKPNVGTLNAVLRSLLLSEKYKEKLDFTLKVMAEFERLGIEPSLGSYGYFFRIIADFPWERNNYYNLCCALMDRIESKKIEVLHPADLEFFKNASVAFSRNYGEPNLLIRLLDLYFRNNNCRLVRSSLEELTFLNAVILNVIRKSPIKVSMDIYRRYFFTRYSANAKVVIALISAIGRSNSSEYLVEVWEDIGNTPLKKNLVLLSKTLSLVKDFSDEASIKLFHSVAISYLSVVEVSGCFRGDQESLSNAFIAFVKNGDEGNILQLMDIMKKNSMVNLDQDATTALYNYGFSEQKIPILLESLGIAASTEHPKFIKMATKALPLLDDDSKAWLTELMNKHNEKKTENEHSGDCEGGSKYAVDV